MKKKRGFSINLTNRWLYTLIAIGILVLVGVGVYAATYSTSGAGHPYTEISTCGANQILKMNPAGTNWTCGNDIDTDTKGSLSCTTRNSGSYVSCDTTCSNNAEVCVSTYPYSSNLRCVYTGTTILECRCCKIV